METKFLRPILLYQGCHICGHKNIERPDPTTVGCIKCGWACDINYYTKLMMQKDRVAVIEKLKRVALRRVI